MLAVREFALGRSEFSVGSLCEAHDVSFGRVSTGSNRYALPGLLPIGARLPTYSSALTQSFVSGVWEHTAVLVSRVRHVAVPLCLYEAALLRSQLHCHREPRRTVQARASCVRQRPGRYGAERSGVFTPPAEAQSVRLLGGGPLDERRHRGALQTASTLPECANRFTTEPFDRLDIGILPHENQLVCSLAVRRVAGLCLHLSNTRLASVERPPPSARHGSVEWVRAEVARTSHRELREVPTLIRCSRPTNVVGCSSRVDLRTEFSCISRYAGRTRRPVSQVQPS